MCREIQPASAPNFLDVLESFSSTLGGDLRSATQATFAIPSPVCCKIGRVVPLIGSNGVISKFGTATRETVKLQL